MKVLLVENKDVCIDVMMAMISGVAKNIVPCHTIEEAETVLDNFSPDVLVIDHNLLASAAASKKLSQVPLVVVASSEYMDHAKNWLSQEGKQIMENAVMRAASRKNAVSRINRLMEQMRNNLNEVESATDSLCLPPPPKLSSTPSGAK